MPVAALALLAAASFVLVVEFSLTAVAGLAVYRPGIERFASLTVWRECPARSSLNST